jgi:hypothetical protein
VPVKETTDSTNFIREHLHPSFVGNKFTKHGQQGEVDAKVFLNINRHQIQEKGLCVSQHENWLSASPDGVFDGQTLLEVKCTVPTFFTLAKSCTIHCELYLLEKSSTTLFL